MKRYFSCQVDKPIETKTKRKVSLRKVVDYKYALDQFAIVAITDQKGIIVYVNENFCKISKYAAEELIGKDHRIINSNLHSESYIKKLWTTIARGGVWRGEFRNQAKDGSFYWVDTTIIPFLNEKGKPHQYLSIRYDITEKKQLQEMLNEQQNRAHLKLTERVLEAQEKERAAIGMELHDNVNQILTGAKLMLSMLKGGEPQKQKFVDDCSTNIQVAIDENRKIARELITPDFKKEKLVTRVSCLVQGMLKNAGLEVYIDFYFLQENLLADQQKLTIYRIMQEQFTNIVKHANARKVEITMSTKNGIFNMVISDDGKGMQAGKNVDGIGLTSIKSRLSVVNGILHIKNEPDKGFSMEIEIRIPGTE